ncbi:MAG: branched-chain amino acid ABC transporter permease [Burkholderiaceae bacterium]|nr:branched-chain amino acid ABC transporter permease [Burkholderiaceae bacterium]
MAIGSPLRAAWVDAPARSRLALLALFAVLVVVPMAADRYVLSVMILILFLAFVGLAWNIMMGFCGQLSLGHALYVGLGAYTAAALYQHFGVVPWIGMLVAVAVCVLAASFIGWLAFRFGIGGTYFSLLTIAFAEFTRIGFDHLNWVGGSGGFFLRVAQGGARDWLNMRGGPWMFYYLALGLTVLAFLLSAWLLRSRAGFYFRAIRDNEEAARAAGVPTFRYKMFAVQISGGLTALAGVFYAFYYNNLFPEQIFAMSRSIEIILAPIIGGIGTLFGPVLGAVLLTLLSEGITHGLDAFEIDVPGVKQILYGVALGLSIMFMPHGVWPGIARRLGLVRSRAELEGKGGRDDE